MRPGKQLVFVTNNSTKSRADYKKKFDGMGISASEVWPVISHAAIGSEAHNGTRTKFSAPLTAQPSTSRASSSSRPLRTRSTS